MLSLLQPPPPPLTCRLTTYLSSCPGSSLCPSLPGPWRWPCGRPSAPPPHQHPHHHHQTARRAGPWPSCPSCPPPRHRPRRPVCVGARLSPVHGRPSASPPHPLAAVVAAAAPPLGRPPQTSAARGPTGGHYGGRRPPYHPRPRRPRLRRHPSTSYWKPPGGQSRLEPQLAGRATKRRRSPRPPAQPPRRGREPRLRLLQALAPEQTVQPPHPQQEQSLNLPPTQRRHHRGEGVAPSGPAAGTAS